MVNFKILLKKLTAIGDDLHYGSTVKDEFITLLVAGLFRWLRDILSCSVKRIIFFALL
jgi:hypothetical protein